MNLRSFTRHYDLDLIPGALETLTMGKCVWDAGIFSKPRMTKPGMPDYIFNVFASKGLMTSGQVDTLMNSLRKQPLVKAEFAQLNIEFEISDATSVDIPRQIDLDAGFDMKRVQKISVTNARGREMPNNLRLQVDAMLDTIKDQHWNEYKSRLRKAYMITQLYYADLSITIDTEIEAVFESALPKDKLKASNKLKFDRSVVYSFPNSTVPFAMRLERIKKFDS